MNRDLFYMSTPFRIPFYAKASIISLGLVAFMGMLYIAQGILVPLIYAVLFAIVLSPFVDLLVRKKMNRVLAITVVIVTMIAGFISLLALMSTQVSMFSESVPKLTVKFDQLLNQGEAWASGRFNIHMYKIHKWMDELNADIMARSRPLIGQTIASIGSVLVIMVLIPVYIFMILFYQPLLIAFIHKLFTSNKMGAVNEVLTSAKKIIQSYLIGLLLEALIVAILNSGSLLLLGIDYAILLGVLGALLNVIPYIGGIVAVALPMIIAFATKSPTYAFLVLGAYLLIQFIDNHFIIPSIVSSKVKVNGLLSIIVVLAGGALWGFPGMFLSLPLTGIMKVVFDHIEELKPWGFLLGNIVPTATRYSIIRQRNIVIQPPLVNTEVMKVEEDVSVSDLK